MKKLHVGFGFWIGLITILLVGGYIWWSSVSKDASMEELERMTSREVALRSTTDMATKFHIHPEIKIVINEVEQNIPEDIGVSAIGMTAIHTHEGGGLIHVEAPIQKDFTIGDFFAVWGKTFTQNQILDSVVDESHQITVTVNGILVDTFDNTMMNDHDKIIISYVKK